MFKYGGPETDLLVAGNFETCAISAASAGIPSLFDNLLPGCTPIAVKSRRFNEEDREFIRCEIVRLSKEGIIQPSVSPWRAQVVIVKDALLQILGILSWCVQEVKKTHDQDLRAHPAWSINSTKYNLLEIFLASGG